MYYVGEEHPLQNKVVMTVKLNDLPLTEDQKRKFILLCGTRFDGKGTFKFSCEKFPHLPQNKKYLSDLLDKLLVEAKVNMIPLPIQLNYLHATYIITLRNRYRYVLFIFIFVFIHLG